MSLWSSSWPFWGEKIAHFCTEKVWASLSPTIWDPVSPIPNKPVSPNEPVSPSEPFSNPMSFFLALCELQSRRTPLVSPYWAYINFEPIKPVVPRLALWGHWSSCIWVGQWLFQWVLLSFSWSFLAILHYVNQSSESILLSSIRPLRAPPEWGYWGILFHYSQKQLF